MKKLTLLTIACFCVNALFAQKGNIKGTITDTFNKINLSNSVISVIRAKDSVLVKFTRSDANGHFALSALPEGKHIVMITYPSYADYLEHVDFTEKPDVDLGSVRLTTKARLLADVTVRQKIAAIRLRGDTIEYNADSFKVRAGASVEDMIRMMPGLQVDKDGNITAQGTKVEKVLVDGEEFFGDDPTMATKNLQASAIDKVQVFDKKSDQAVFTGIDDGSKTKTINLTMKANMKKGYFGKLDLGAGPSNRWNTTAMVNSFRDKRKISAYGIMSSTGKTGLDWSESSKFGSDNGMQYDADGGFFFTSGGGDDLDGGGGSFYGQGLPTSWSAGLNYSKKFNLDKQNFNGSYRYNKLNTEGGGNTISQSILPGNTFNTRESRNFFTSKQRNSVNGTYEFNIDSFTSIKIVMNGYLGKIKAYNTNTSETLDSIGNLINRSNRNSTAEGDNSSFNTNMTFRKRFKKIGRTISASFEEQYKNTDTEGFLYSQNQFYSKTGLLLNRDSVNQKKLNDITNSGYYVRVAYTEPVLTKLFLELSTGYRVSQSESKKLSYDRGLTGKYEVLNDTFSNHYDYKVNTSSFGMMWRYNGKKLMLSGGGDVAFAQFNQTDVIRDQLVSYNYTNLFPRGNFTYKFNTNSRVSLNYNGNTRQPSVEQLQPVKDNTNTLNIAVGNPNLKQEFRHAFNLNFNRYKVLSQSGFNIYSNFSLISNAISTSDQTAVSGDSIGRRTFQFINVNGNYNGYLGSNYSMRIKKFDLGLNFSLNLSVNRNNNIVNKLKNVTDNNSYGFNFGMYKYKDKKYDIGYSANVRYNTSVSSIRPDVKTNYYTHGHNLNANVMLPKKFEVSTSVNANFRQRTTAFANNDQIIWNGSFGRKFLKNDQGLISIAAFDILDQNRGYNRLINSTIIREDTYETLRRYFMLKFVWNFSKSPAGTMPGQ